LGKGPEHVEHHGIDGSFKNRIAGLRKLPHYFVAARLEALAELGGLCISRIVRDQVRDRLDLTR
jgi:hypothetical protein